MTFIIECLAINQILMRHWDAQDVKRDDAIFSPFVTASSAVIICYKNTD